MSRFALPKSLSGCRASTRFKSSPSSGCSGVRAAKRVSLGLKVTSDIKSRLDEAAQLSGRTQSQEAEIRLTQSFEKASIAAGAMILAYGRTTTALAMILARAMHDAGTHAGFLSTGTTEGAREWMTNPSAFDQVASAVAEVMDKIRPDGEVKPLLTGASETDAKLMHLGKLIASGILEAVKNSERGGEIGEWARPIRELLGEASGQIRVDDRLVVISASAPSAGAPSILAVLSNRHEGGDAP